MHRKFLCSSLPAMARSYSASEAARALGISLDTLRRWDRQGRIRVERDSANRRTVPAEEIARLRGSDDHALSARNRFRGIVREVKIEGLLAQVELEPTVGRRLLSPRRREATVRGRTLCADSPRDGKPVLADDATAQGPTGERDCAERCGSERRGQQSVARPLLKGRRDDANPDSAGAISTSILDGAPGNRGLRATGRPGGHEEASGRSPEPRLDGGEPRRRQRRPHPPAHRSRRRAAACREGAPVPMPPAGGGRWR